MKNTRFIQVHFLTSYPASLLNRDDAGFAKRIPFGGATRTRISSQCLKRHWRSFSGEHSLGELAIESKMEMSVRSRRSFEQFVYKPLCTEGIAEPVAHRVTEELMAHALGKSDKKKANADPDSANLATEQVTVLGRPELEFLLSEARAICHQVSDPAKAADAVKKHLTRERIENLRNMRRGAGLDAALFGRMVTSDILARCDGALHVAHAFTVHAEATESDYFSVVDDLLKDAEEQSLGSGHIGSAELTTGLFYGYVVADVPLLADNLGGDRPLAAQAIERMVTLAATVSPGAKLGSTAPHAYAHLVMAEAGKAQPRTLANAFLVPVSDRPDLLANTYAAFAEHLAELDQAYGAVERRVLALGPRHALTDVLTDQQHVKNIGELAQWAAERVGAGQ